MRVKEISAFDASFRPFSTGSNAVLENVWDHPMNEPTVTSMPSKYLEYVTAVGKNDKSQYLF